MVYLYIYTYRTLAIYIYRLKRRDCKKSNNAPFRGVEPVLCSWEYFYSVIFFEKKKVTEMVLLYIYSSYPFWLPELNPLWRQIILSVLSLNKKTSIFSCGAAAAGQETSMIPAQGWRRPPAVLRGARRQAGPRATGTWLSTPSPFFFQRDFAGVLFVYFERTGWVFKCKVYLDRSLSLIARVWGFRSVFIWCPFPVFFGAMLAH